MKTKLVVLSWVCTAPWRLGSRHYPSTVTHNSSLRKSLDARHAPSETLPYPAPSYSHNGTAFLPSWDQCAVGTAQLACGRGCGG